MTDLALAWDAGTRTADLCLAGADLLSDGSLRSAVIVSLFSDARAAPEDVAPDESRRGWWGDALGDGERTGSLLWLLAREKQTAEVLVRAEQYARSALAWLLADGVAVAVAVAAQWVERGHLVLRVVIDQRGGAVEYRFGVRDAL